MRMPRVYPLMRGKGIQIYLGEVEPTNEPSPLDALMYSIGRQSVDREPQFMSSRLTNVPQPTKRFERLPWIRGINHSFPGVTNRRRGFEASVWELESRHGDAINGEPAFPKLAANRTYRGHDETDANDPERTYRRSQPGTHSGSAGLTAGVFAQFAENRPWTGMEAVR